MALTLNHQTKQEFANRLREKYQNSTREETARIAHKLYEWYAAGDITKEQVKSAFGFDEAQWITFRDKVLALRDHWIAIQAAEGE